MKFETGLLGVCAAGVFLAVGGAARAEETAKVQVSVGTGEHPEPKHEEGAKGEEEEPSGSVAADMVLGFGKVATWLPGPTGVSASGQGGPPGLVNGSSRITTEAFLLGAEFHLLKHTSIGFRFPISIGEFDVPGGNDFRSTTAIGNFELALGYEREIAEHVGFLFDLGIALPTAQGQEIPDNLDQLEALQVNPGRFDQASVNRAASYSRGGEDAALYEIKRLGIIPKVGVDYHAKGLFVTASVKVENMISVATGAKPDYLGELVPAVGIGYRAAPHLVPELRMFAPIAFSGAPDDEKKVGFVLEPQIVMPFGNVRPVVGVYIPVAGPAADPQFIGVRVGVVAAF
jgi:hypothetical protein